MAGSVAFTISIQTEGGGELPELKARLEDFSPAFHSIVDEWAGLNRQKFDLSVGKEPSGAAVDELVFWKGLRPGTMKAKRRAGQPDQIMVATGSLMHSLTDPGLIFRFVNAEQAIFGTPSNAEDAAKAGYQWRDRQAVFFSTIDQNMVRRVLQDYLEMGAGFKEQRFVKGLETARMRREKFRMDAEFKAGSGEGEF